MATANDDADLLDRVFSALGDATRREIIMRLAQGPATVGELAAPHAMSAPAITKHLHVLERAGLMRRFKEGRRHWCTLEAEGIRAAEGWMAEQHRLWRAMLAALERELAAQGHAGRSARKKH
jgi:DNA-binding transcriptional ArsR family regulator